MAINTIQLLEPSHLEQIASLHRRAFTDSALTKLGHKPVRRYYEWLLTGPFDRFAIGTFDENHTLIGFCFSGIFAGSLSGFLAGNRLFLYRWILTHPWLILNPLVIDRIKFAFSLFFGKKPSHNKSEVNLGRSFGILSIAVDPAQRRMGIGRIIADAVEKEAQRRGYSQMHLSVHPSNTGAVTFYERCGWTKLDPVDGKWIGTMIKKV